MGYDLHTHSIYSDGTSKPAELITKAINRSLDGIALTDHDSIAGIAEATCEANKHHYTFIPGVELTTDYGASEVHILGYNFDLNSRQLLQKLEKIAEARNERAKLIIKKLNQHNLPLSWGKVRAQTTSRFIGRSHIFKALEREGMIAGEHRQGAFEYYLGKNGVAYVPHTEIDALEAIQLINSIGGVSVLAHPGRMNNDSLIPELVAAGLKGLEVFYPAHTPQQTTKYLELAQDYHLFGTGGSDYHGALSQTKLGDGQVDKIDEWYFPK
jgi:predicted metal-dependent phosphoesterase TrpH